MVFVIFKYDWNVSMFMIRKVDKFTYALFWYSSFIDEVMRIESKKQKCNMLENIVEHFFSTFEFWFLMKLKILKSNNCQIKNKNKKYCSFEY